MSSSCGCGCNGSGACAGGTRPNFNLGGCVSDRHVDCGCGGHAAAVSGLASVVMLADALGESSAPRIGGSIKTCSPPKCKLIDDETLVCTRRCTTIKAGV